MSARTALCRTDAKRRRHGYRATPVRMRGPCLRATAASGPPPSRRPPGAPATLRVGRPWRPPQAIVHGDRARHARSGREPRRADAASPGHVAPGHVVPPCRPATPPGHLDPDTSTRSRRPRHVDPGTAPATSTRTRRPRRTDGRVDTLPTRSPGARRPPPRPRLGTSTRERPLGPTGPERMRRGPSMPGGRTAHRAECARRRQIFGRPVSRRLNYLVDRRGQRYRHHSLAQ